MAPVHQHRYQVQGHQPADGRALLAIRPDLPPKKFDFISILLIIRAPAYQAGVPFGQSRTKGDLLGKPPEGFLHQQRHAPFWNRAPGLYDGFYRIGQGRIGGCQLL